MDWYFTLTVAVTLKLFIEHIILQHRAADSRKWPVPTASLSPMESSVRLETSGELFSGNLPESELVDSTCLLETAYTYYQDASARTFQQT
jgi:hypothetical protein